MSKVFEQEPRVYISPDLEIVAINVENVFLNTSQTEPIIDDPDEPM